MTIVALDHVTLDVIDLAAAGTDYAALLGHTPMSDRFQLGNMALHLVAAAEPALAGVGFATDNLAKAHRLLTQRALTPAPIESGKTALPREATHGIPIAVVEAAGRAAPAPADPSAIAGLDHLVIGTPNPERAIVLYAGRLGLDLRLDRTNSDWGVRLLFFRCGDLVIEVAHRLGKGVSDGPDRFMGFSWRASDLAAVHNRLATAGFDISELRTGRRPGTRVFTVRDRTAGVPTIVLGPTSSSPRAAAAMMAPSCGTGRAQAVDCAARSVAGSRPVWPLLAAPGLAVPVAAWAPSPAREVVAPWRPPAVAPVRALARRRDPCGRGVAFPPSRQAAASASVERQRVTALAAAALPLRPGSAARR